MNWINGYISFDLYILWLECNYRPTSVSSINFLEAQLINYRGIFRNGLITGVMTMIFIDEVNARHNAKGEIDDFERSGTINCLGGF